MEKLTSEPGIEYDERQFVVHQPPGTITTRAHEPPGTRAHEHKIGNIVRITENRPT